MTAEQRLRLGSAMPAFKADSTKGAIDLYEYKKDAWCILFSHPEDFTPVCTTELGAAARLTQEWAKRNIKLLGLSCNTLESHDRWIQDINETQNCTVDFPIVADPDRRVATLYDMLDYQDATNVDKKGIPFTVRSVFISDPKNIIRLVITYPASCGRNFDEILRVCDALQVGDKHKVATPVNWKKGEPVIIPPTVNDVDAKRLFPSYKTVKPYLRYAELPNV